MTALHSEIRKVLVETQLSTRELPSPAFAVPITPASIARTRPAVRRAPRAGATPKSRTTSATPTAMNESATPTTTSAIPMATSTSETRTATTNATPTATTSVTRMATTNATERRRRVVRDSPPSVQRRRDIRARRAARMGRGRGRAGRLDADGRRRPRAVACQTAGRRSYGRPSLLLLPARGVRHRRQRRARELGRTSVDTRARSKCRRRID